MKHAMSPRIHRNGVVRARGAASLAVTLIMLALSGLVILYAHRGQIFEQRVSANQMRATTAFEAAEAGVEWGLARLNDKSDMLPPSSTATCLAAGSGTARFNSFYLTLAGDPATPTLFTVGAVANMRAGCTINDTTGALTCNCPSSGNAVAIPSTPGPGTRSFEVTYSALGAADVGIVRISAIGCRNATSGGAAAFCNSAGSTEDARATVSVLAKFVPAAGSISRAAVTAGGYIAACGSFNIVNTSTNAGGYLANSGLNTQVGGAGNGLYTSGPVGTACGGGGGMSLTTVAGKPIGAAIVPNDTALLTAAASSDTMMQTYFGMTKQQYINDPLTAQIGGATAAARETALLSAYGAGYRRFWINGSIGLNAVTLGSATVPIMLASAGDITINGVSRIYGIVYSDTDLNYNGSGASAIYGQLVVRGNLYTNGQGTIDYSGSVLTEVLKTSGEFVRVPGSWTDS